MRERVIYLDTEQATAPLRFVYGHEIGHGALPWHEDAYCCDDHRTLDPDTADELEAPSKRTPAGFASVPPLSSRKST